MAIVQWFREHPRVADGVLACGLLLVGVSQAASAADHVADPASGEWVRPAGLGWLLLLIPPFAVAFRRSQPLPALVVGSAATMVMWANALPETMLAAAVLLYSAVMHVPAPEGRMAAMTAGLVLIGFTLIGVAAGGAPIWVLPLVIATTITAISVGQHMRTREAYTAEVERRAVDAEARRDADERAIIEQERNRIARDLHDVVAHGLSVIVVQATAGQRVLDRDKEGTRSALAQIERTSRESLNEMRRVLGILRSDTEDEFRPVPGIGAMGELTADFESSGLRVQMDIDPSLKEQSLVNATLDTSAYRIVQESLTNALKHGGPGTEARVQLSRRDNHLEISVIDDGVGSSPDAGGTGQGLRGMQERIELFGGSLRSGPRFAGGFEVHAIVPFDAVQV